MSTPFQQLKNNFRAISKDLNTDALLTAQNALKEWVASYSGEIAAKKAPAEFNGTMMQWFHWYLPADGTHWQTLQHEAPALAAAGFTALWLPPAYKGIGGSYDVGYGVYDIFDLGEFDQRGTVRTKYGTKDEYVEAVRTCRQNGIQIYADVVFNHKMAADFEEEFDAIPYDPRDRHRPLGDRRKIKAWTGFDFPGRGDKYSTMKWRWYHFDSVDYNSYEPDFKAVWKMADKSFETKVDLEKGNFDYLMGSDLDMNHPEVKGELKYWGEWMLDEIGADGFRLDAIKHINGDFFNEWLDHLEAHTGRDLFCVGEYWTYNFGTLSWYIGNAGGAAQPVLMRRYTSTSTKPARLGATMTCGRFLTAP